MSAHWFNRSGSSAHWFNRSGSCLLIGLIGVVHLCLWPAIVTPYLTYVQLCSPIAIVIYTPSPMASHTSS